ncbi:transposable element tcb1 transposase, partial [Lasius niger]
MEAVISWYGGALHGLVLVILARVEGIMTAERYIDILYENLEESLLKLDLENNFIFQQNNDPKHKAKKITAFFKSNKVKLLECPPQSPYLNPIGNLWAYLDRNVDKTNVTDKTSYYAVLQKAWEEIDPEYLKKLVESMPRRLE